jgi:general secretion pathway protein J
MNAQRPIQRTSGFTLLELLIAVAVFAVVLGAINSVFYSALRLRNSTTTVIEESLPLQRAVAIIKRDLANLVPPGGVLGGELQSTVSSGNLAGQVGPDFHTAAGLIDDYSPWGEVQRVAYLLVDPPDRSEGRDLVRVVTHNLLPVLTEEPEDHQWLLGNVAQVEFLFFDGMQWVESWDSSVEERLPRGIKVQIHMEAGGTFQMQEAPIEIVVPIHVQAENRRSEVNGGGIQ